MTDAKIIHEIKEAIRNEMSVHVSYIREDISGLKRDVANMKHHGCTVGAKNAQRLDELDKRAGLVGGLAGLIVAIAGWFVRRGS